jgi:hypothetical protein
MSTRAQLEELLAHLNGYRRSCLLSSALKVGLLQALRERPRAPEPLAQDLGLHGPTLVRVIPLLVELGALQYDGDRVGLTRASKLLVDGWMSSWGQLIAEEYVPAWSQLEHSLRSGQASFPVAFGHTVWEHRQAYPEEGVRFQRVMLAVQQRVLGALLASYDFSGFSHIVDLGGGEGGLLRGLLEHVPQARGTLLDRPEVVAGLSPRAEERWQAVGGDLLQAVPAGGDLYLLKHVLHNWSDQDCQTILRGCAQILTDSARLLIVEGLRDPSDPESLWVDLHMLLIHGGRERSLDEFRQLLVGSGLRLLQHLPMRGGVSVLEVARA